MPPSRLHSAALPATEPTPYGERRGLSSSGNSGECAAGGSLGAFIVGGLFRVTPLLDEPGGESAVIMRPHVSVIDLAPVPARKAEYCGRVACLAVALCRLAHWVPPSATGSSDTAGGI